MQTPKPSIPGPERLILAVALIVPLAMMLLAAAQIPGAQLGTTSDAAASPLSIERPAPSDPPPPPTLAPPTLTPVPPTPTAAPTVAPTPVASPTPRDPRSYTVQRGDELKQIAAQYDVSIWTIIDANDIPNPDSLKVGQVLHIPVS